jgi:AcrR family transcriptional regulator
LSRDRFATRAAILESAATIIATHGAAKLGVNALADAAKCDKVLIYRYFGGLDGVLSALGAERMLWPRVEAGAAGSEETTLAQALRTVLLEEWAALSEGALARESAAAEASGVGALAGAVAEQRAESHARVIAALREAHRIPPYIDLAALMELLSAALAMFALRGSKGSERRGEGGAPGSQPFDPATPEGWRRIEKMVAAITRALLEPAGG